MDFNLGQTCRPAYHFPSRNDLSLNLYNTIRLLQDKYSNIPSSSGVKTFVYICPAPDLYDIADGGEARSVIYITS